MFVASKKTLDSAARLAALDAADAKIMIADDKLNITYVNAAAMSLMQQAEAELRKELPRFSIATLIGSNIDVFYKNPAHQRTTPGARENPHGATIQAGPHVLDLQVTPLIDRGRRAGFVLQWACVDARLHDHANQIAAINRSQAVIEFTIDGIILDANAVFLQAVGYRLEEVRGKHHSIFVPPGHEKTKEYAAFWDRLRHGEFQAGQFKRVAKTGREIWIEGAYNPIVAADGKVSRVMKVASDVTAQVALLTNLKRLIDINFAEIDTAIDRSASASASAGSAADETSANVQSLTASAHQLAASIAEIAQSMAKSRAATDSAFDQAVTVGTNTDTLTRAAQAMNGIVALIRNVASQINLLALNATIEAARAGDAGKGFAVVASEVKSLAVEAARATDRIATEIDGIQSISSEVAAALTAIQDSVTIVRESVAMTAAAVEEQSAVTRSMSANMQSASEAVSTVSSNIVAISTAVQQAAGVIAKTKEAAQVLVR